MSDTLLVVLGVAVLDLWAVVVAVLGLAEVGRMSVLRTLVVYALGGLPLIAALGLALVVLLA
jgi:hypothetical protein